MTDPDFTLCRSVRLADGTMSPPPPHVREGVKLVMAKPAFMIQDEMGGMKSAQTIIAAQFLWLDGVLDRVLVVSPASVRDVWYDQDVGQIALHSFVPSRIVEVHTAMRSWDYADFNEGSGRDLQARHDSILRSMGGNGLASGKAPAPRRLEWLITNYEWLRTNHAMVGPYCNARTLLVLDESAAVKNYKAEQAKACALLRSKCGRVLLLNGTPIANSPEDMFSQGNIMDKRILECRYVTEFRARYSVQTPVLTAGGRPLQVTTRGGKKIEVTKASAWVNLDDLQRRFAPYVVRRLTKDCLDLPGVLPPVALTVQLTPGSWRIYKEMRDELVALLESGNAAVTQHAATKVMRLAQITSGFVGGVTDAYGDGGFLDFSADPDQFEDDEFLSSISWRGDGMVAQGSALPEEPLDPVAAPAQTQEIGREKLEATLDRIEDYYAEDPSLKILVWVRFIPELRRFLREAAKRFPAALIGSIAGESCLEGISEFGGSVKTERKWSIGLLHPASAPKGPAIIGGTYGTGALGLNFTACHTVINMSYDYSYFKAVQSAARVARPGQTNVIRTTDVVATGPKGQQTIDHVVLKARLGKANLAEMTTAAWVKALKEE